MAHPLVSCIMPTRNRRLFFQHALRAFDQQTWPTRELVVVDDGDDSVRDLCEGRADVRYVRLERGTPTGVKLNAGVAAATGTVVQRLDDDDYYAPRFVETSMRALAAAPDDAIVGWDCFLVLLAGERRLRFSGHGWMAGGTLAFRRGVWERTPFREIWRGTDTHLLADHTGPTVPMCEPEQYVLVRHGSNSWTEMGDERTDAYLGRQPYYHKALERIAAADAVAFWRSLPATSLAPSDRPAS
jgi:glycosyltransferase involved in cell wall biosynthesis